MNYPYGGYDYGYPPQPYPQQYAPYPQYPPPPRPGGGTAITAGVLALLGGLVGALSSVAAGISLAAVGSSVTDGMSDNVKIVLIVGLAVGGLTTLFLLLGSLLLFLRRTSGRVLVILGCLGALAGSAVSLVTTAGVASDLGEVEGMGSALGVSLGVTAAMSLFPLLTLILAAVPATGRWIADRNTPRYY